MIMTTVNIGEVDLEDTDAVAMQFSAMKIAGLKASIQIKGEEEEIRQYFALLSQDESMYRKLVQQFGPGILPGALASITVMVGMAHWFWF